MMCLLHFEYTLLIFCKWVFSKLINFYFNIQTKVSDLELLILKFFCINIKTQIVQNFFFIKLFIYYIHYIRFNNYITHIPMKKEYIV